MLKYLKNIGVFSAVALGIACVCHIHDLGAETGRVLAVYHANARKDMSPKWAVRLNWSRAGYDALTFDGAVNNADIAKKVMSTYRCSPRYIHDNPSPVIAAGIRDCSLQVLRYQAETSEWPYGGRMRLFALDDLLDAVVSFSRSRGGQHTAPMLGQRHVVEVLSNPLLAILADNAVALRERLTRFGVPTSITDKLKSVK